MTKPDTHNQFKRVTVLLRPETYAALRRMCFERNLEMSAEIRKMIETAILKQPRKRTNG